MNTRHWKREPAARTRQRRERGSALLIVLVFAAIVAIMLYRELPIAAFEAQRQKEELLVFRGNEYKRAVKLFVRKIGRFPNSLDELESTNRMRFLRRKYVDPLTGKSDWRLIHAGPGGTIVDSKVQTTSTKDKSANALGQGATFGGFNNSFSGDLAAAAADNTPTSAALRQRPAATKNAGSNTNDPLAVAAGTANSTTDPNADGTLSNNAQGSNNTPGATDPTTGMPKQAPNGAGGDPGIASTAQQLNNVNPKTPEAAPSGQPSAFGNTSAFGNSSNSLTGNNGNGQIAAAGGIAGVASVAEGKSIKAVNDQTKYKLWEFYYDLRKEQTAAAGTLGQPQNAQNANGIQNGNQNGGQNNSAFGQTQGSSQQSSFGFGSSSPSNAQGAQQPTTQAQPAQQ